MKQIFCHRIQKSLDLFKFIFILLFLILPANVIMNAQEAAKNELDVIRNNWLLYSDASNSLYHHISGQAYELLDIRTKKISALNSLSDWQQRQQWIRETLLDIIGPFPEKTPLNAKIARIVEKDSFRIENIIFESQPGFFVTSSMFIPAWLKKRDKAPAIIY